LCVVDLLLAVIFLVPTLSLAFSVAKAVSLFYNGNLLIGFLVGSVSFVLGGAIGAGIGALLVIWTGGLVSGALNFERNLRHLTKKKGSLKQDS